MVWKVVAILLLVAANGFFVAAEFALVKVRLGDIRLLARTGSRTAMVAERVLGSMDAYLSACQLGITLASLGLGWVGEPLVARSLEPVFDTLGISQDWLHVVSLPLAFSIITFLHITAGEQAPKIMAIERSQSVTLAVAVPLDIFFKIFRPFISMLNSSSNWMLRAIGIRVEPGHAEILTEDQLRLVLVDSVRAGHVSRRERLLMENVLDLEDKTARRHMVPRHQIVHIDRNDSMEEMLRKVSGSGHTRLPLCEGNLDHVIGMVHVKDLFQALTRDGELTTLADVARKALFLPDSVRLDALLREFQRSRVPVALLVDEYGVVSGMITLENVLEELVGPILDEFDDEVSLIVKQGEHRFEVDATCPLDEVVTRCGLILPKDTDVDTIGGVAVALLGHIPETGETLTVGDHTITVLEAGPTRILRVLIDRRLPSGETVPAA